MLWLEDKQETEEAAEAAYVPGLLLGAGLVVHGHGSSKLCSQQLFWLHSCVGYFGLVAGEPQLSFALPLTKTAFTEVTKQEVVGQSPIPFDINTVNPVMTTFL